MSIKIYTKTGDKGLTSLVDCSSRVPKDDKRIQLYGEVDYLNSFLGLSICSILTETQMEEDTINKKNNLEKKDKLLQELIIELRQIQVHLFEIGSILACPSEKREKFKLKTITEKEIQGLEKSIDQYDLVLEPLRKFVLPGSSTANAHLNICRTVTRKIERNLISYHREAPSEIPNALLIYFNRLSDYFFITGRFTTTITNKKETLWT
ncbi:MAG: cob(I)yrinic acid a,c-diamide adenosyltransferase [Bdellovibrionaceae bacterium]|nr:cob(I)yrinic acid a,c-diamide adenosyltransferase [Pseudobdellovibrionaceae bacterium]